MATLTDAVIELCEALLPTLGVQFDEAKGEYYYDTENVKRWVADGGSCDICSDNEDLGWIGDDDVFDSDQFGDVDEPPAHSHCGCTVEYREKRVRVYL